MARLPIRYRIAKAIAGSHGKSFIPPLNPDGGIGFPKGRTPTYDTKSDQLGALTSWVFTANGAIADPCAAVEYKLFRKKSDGDKEEITSGPQYDDIMELIDSPNLALTGEQMRQLHFTYMNIIGESNIYMRGMKGEPFIPAKGKLPAALDIFPAHLTQFILGTTYTSSVIKVGNIEYPILSFIRDLNPDPSNPYVGRSIVKAAAQAIGTNETMKEWNQSVFANNARPSLVFQTNTGVSMDDASYKRWQQQFQDEHTGVGAAGKPLLIEQGSVTPMMINQSDLEYLEGQKFTRDEILAMFRVSPGMIGQVENVNRANLEAGFYVNAVTNVVPRVRQFVKQLNSTLIKVYDPTLELDFVNPVPEDVEAKLAAVTAGVNKWWTIDEARDMYGQEPLPDGLGEHIIVTGVSATTLETVVAGQVAEPESTGDKPVDVDEDPDEDDNGDESTDETKSLSGVKKKI